jgi:hypothetical protein
MRSFAVGATQVFQLVRGELELAKAELAEKGKRAGAGAGVVLAWFVVGALVTAAIAGLAVVRPVWLAALIVDRRHRRRAGRPR